MLYRRVRTRARRRLYRIEVDRGRPRREKRAHNDHLFVVRTRPVAAPAQAGSDAATAPARGACSSRLPDAASAVNMSAEGSTSSALCRKLLPSKPPTISTCPLWTATLSPHRCRRSETRCYQKPAWKTGPSPAARAIPTDPNTTAHTTSNTHTAHVDPRPLTDNDSVHNQPPHLSRGSRWRTTLATCQTGRVAETRSHRRRQPARPPRLTTPRCCRPARAIRR